MAKRQKHLKRDSNTTSNAHPSEFDKLLRFIVNFQGRFALAFIRGDDGQQREGVLASLADLLKEKDINLIRVDLAFHESTNLLTTLKNECGQSDHGAIVVTGIEASLNENLLASLNVQRDLISQQIKCPILFWVSIFALNLFAKQAPDFYDFRQTVFNFPSPRAHEASLPVERTAQSSIAFESVRPTHQDWNEHLLSQLEKYQKNEENLGPRERLAYAELLEEFARSYRDMRHRTEATPYLQKALAIYAAVKDRSRQAAVLQALGDTYYYSGNQPKAAENFDVALRLYREIGNRLGEATVLQSLGDVKRMQASFAEAEGLLLRAMGIFAAINDSYSQGATLLSLANLYRAAGSKQKAESAARRARDLLKPYLNLVERADKLIRELS